MECQAIVEPEQIRVAWNKGFIEPRSVETLKLIVKRKDRKIKYLQHQSTLSRKPFADFGCGSSSQREQSASSCMLLALLRCSGHGSSKQILTIGQVLAHNVKIPTTRQTLSTWEVATGTTVLSRACKFHEDMEMAMLSPDAVNSGQWMAAGHVVMGDATRSKAWRDDKIQPLCLVSWYCSEDADISSHTAWPDVQVVKSESAAANFIRMHKQLRLVQCCCFDVGEATRLGARQVRMIWLCGDNGSDQLLYSANGCRHVQRPLQRSRVWYAMPRSPTIIDELPAVDCSGFSMHKHLQAGLQI